MDQKHHPIEKMTAAFIYDRSGNLLSSTIVEIEQEQNHISFESNGFSSTKTAKDMLDSFKDVNGVDHVAGWLSSSSGRCRCFVVPPTRAAAGDLLQYLEAIERLYFKHHPEAAAFDIKPNATKS